MSRFVRRIMARTAGAPLQALQHANVRRGPAPVIDPFEAGENSDLAAPGDAEGSAAAPAPRPAAAPATRPASAAGEAVGLAPLAGAQGEPTGRRDEVAEQVRATSLSPADSEPAHRSLPSPAPPPPARGEASSRAITQEHVVRLTLEESVPQARHASDRAVSPSSMPEGEANTAASTTSITFAQLAAAPERRLAMPLPGAAERIQSEPDARTQSREPASQRLEPPVSAPSAPAASPAPQITIGRVSVVVEAPRPAAPPTAARRVRATRPSDDAPAPSGRFGLGQL
jgi:hypothetical protein